MKIMQLLSSVKHDDSERGIYHIAHALIKKGHESIIIADGEMDDDFVVRLTRDGSDYYKLSMPKKSWLSLRHVFRLKKLIDHHKPDIIHVHSRTPAWVLHWALRLSPKPRPKIIATMYGFYPLNSYSKALFDADVLISASKSIDKYLKNALRELDDDDSTAYIDQIVCIRRGVDARIYPYRHKPSVHWLQNIFSEFEELEHKKWLIFPTVIGAEYGQEWLIDIIGNLKDKYPKLHVIIMDNDTSDELSQSTAVIYDDFRQRVTALNLDKYISFVGKKPADLKDWLSSAHVVLALANQPESIGMTALQAIHLGTPVIGWDKGAFSDILTALYPRGLIKHQDAKSLCTAIASQLETGIRPNITHEYEIEKMVKETLFVYHQLFHGLDIHEKPKDNKDKK